MDTKGSVLYIVLSTMFINRSCTAWSKIWLWASENFCWSWNCLLMINVTFLLGVLQNVEGFQCLRPSDWEGNFSFVQKSRGIQILIVLMDKRSMLRQTNIDPPLFFAWDSFCMIQIKCGALGISLDVARSLGSLLHILHIIAAVFLSAGSIL